MLPVQVDFLIIGGGIIGITVSIELKSSFPDASIILIEKENKTGQHASGRNSGVLHAGFYYSADSYKAKLTREGNRALTEYCLERKLPVNRCGKLVVSDTEEDLTGLHELAERGKVNGVQLEMISHKEACEIEPKVKTVEQALFSPTTSSISPEQINQSLYQDAINKGVRIFTDTNFISNENNIIKTNRGTISAGYVINAAGLFADSIARLFGFSQQYTILPFKGLYLYSGNSITNFKCHIYPVPDIRNPFLGVHLTVDVNGRTKIGPTAMPAFWRENYKGMKNFNLSELVQITGMETRLFISNYFGFRKLAMEELGKMRRKKLVALASRLASGIYYNDFTNWGRPGIRAQLLNTKTMTLEMDFCFEGDDRSFHILNAVSPAFTCALPFSRLVVHEINQKINT